MKIVLLVNDVIRLAAFLFVPFLVFGEVIEVDVGAWADIGTGMINGWEVSGISRTDDGLTRVKEIADYVRSPEFDFNVTQLIMRVLCASAETERFLTITPTISEPEAQGHTAERSTKLIEQVFAWNSVEGVRQFRLQNGFGSGKTSWGIASLAVYTDRIEPPLGLRDDAPYRDAFLATWDGVPGAEKYQLRYARCETVAAWDFSVLTNTSGNTVDLPKLQIPESLGVLSGTNVCMQGYEGGHIQIGKGEKLGCLVLPMPPVAGGAGAMIGVLCAWKYPKTGKSTMPLYYIADGETNDLATVELTDERAEYRFPIPAGLAAESVILSSATNGIALADQNGRVRVEGFAIVSGPAVTGDFAVVGSPAAEKLVRGLSPGCWAWSVRVFDAKGIDSPWSAFRSVTLDAAKPPLVPSGAILLLR